MASPHVAGTAALLLGQGLADGNGNGRVNNEVRNALAASALDIGLAGRDLFYGFGPVRVPEALAAATAPALTVGVNAISYAASGNGKVKKDLTITAGTVYGLVAPTGATVFLDVFVNGAFYTSTSLTTDQNGVGSKLLRNTPSGTYTTVVTSAIAAGLTWDGVTPPNSFVK